MTEHTKRNSDPDVQIICGSRVAVIADGVAANHQILNSIRIEQLQKFFEVFR